MNSIVNCSAHNVPLEGVIHVGANHGREYAAYARYINGPVLFLEAIPEFVDEIEAKLDTSKPHYVRRAIVGDEAGRPVSFNVASNDGRSSSVLPMGTLPSIRPNISYVDKIEGQMERLDDIVLNEYADEHFNLLVIDTQGADLLVLQGAERILDRIDAICVEIAAEPAYVGGAEFIDIHQFLHTHGFVIRDVDMIREGWGDAFFTRREGLINRFAQRSLARGCAAELSTTYRDFSAGRAVSGDIVTSLVQTQPSEQQNPWWKVDLGEVRDVERILLVDRPNFEAAMASLQIEVSVDDERWRTVYARQGRSNQFMVDRRLQHRVRYVRVSLSDPPPGGTLSFKQLIVL